MTFESRFLEVTVYKIYTFFSLNSTKINNLPRTPCQSLTDPQGSADHSLGNAALDDLKLPLPRTSLARILTHRHPGIKICQRHPQPDYWFFLTCHFHLLHYQRINAHSFRTMPHFQELFICREFLCHKAACRSRNGIQQPTTCTSFTAVLNLASYLSSQSLSYQIFIQSVYTIVTNN